jgi:hypothetical protein
MPRIKVVNEGQVFLRALPEEIVREFGIDIQTSEATREAFNIRKMPSAHEYQSYWGILGFGLIWPVVLLSAVGLIKSTDARILSLAAVLFFLSQAYAAPYDPWRGRYFTTAAVCAVPVIGVCLHTKGRIMRSFLFLIILAGCVSALSAVVLKSRSPLISISYQNKHRTSVFAMERMEQLTRNSPGFYKRLKRFEQLVPRNATVAVFLSEDRFEYPLFGEDLTRTIIPINSFDRGLRPIPANAEYLLYGKGFPCADTADVHLGADWYLRRLLDNDRRCP